MRPQLLIHGGIGSAKNFDKNKKETQTALAAIASASYDYLQTHSALDTAVYAAILLEDCPLLNAGTGSTIQSDGKIRMTASIMDGVTRRFAGVINIEDVKNPIIIASKLLDKKDNVLAGAQALNFARAAGFAYHNPETPERRKDFEEKLSSPPTGTVGCVVLDAEGHLAASTSTGGKGFEIPGRVSDSSTVAGNYATRYAAISCTGVGEDIVNCALAARIATRVEDGFSLQDAASKSMSDLMEYKGYAGIIALDREGNRIHTASHPYLTYAAHDGTLTVYGE